MRQVLKEVLLLCLPPSLFFAENQLSCWAISDLLRAIWGLLSHPERKLTSWRTCWSSAFSVPAPLHSHIVSCSSLPWLCSLLRPPCSSPSHHPPFGFQDLASRCVCPALLLHQDSLVHSLLSFKLSLHHLHEDFPHHQHSIASPNPCFFWLFFLGIFSSLHPVHWFAWCPSFPTRGFVCFVNC